MAGKRQGQRHRRRQRARKERHRKDGHQPVLERHDAREASDAITDVALLEELAAADRPIVLHPPLLHGDERVREYEDPPPPEPPPRAG
jgi:hypothetical protein